MSAWVVLGFLLVVGLVDVPGKISFFKEDTFGEKSVVSPVPSGMLFIFRENFVRDERMPQVSVSRQRIRGTNEERRAYEVHFNAVVPLTGIFLTLFESGQKLIERQLGFQFDREVFAGKENSAVPNMRHDIFTRRDVVHQCVGLISSVYNVGEQFEVSGDVRCWRLANIKNGNLPPDAHLSVTKDEGLGYFNINLDPRSIRGNHAFAEGVLSGFCGIRSDLICGLGLPDGSARSSGRFFGFAHHQLGRNGGALGVEQRGCQQENAAESKKRCDPSRVIHPPGGLGHTLLGGEITFINGVKLAVGIFGIFLGYGIGVYGVVRLVNPWRSLAYNLVGIPITLAGIAIAMSSPLLFLLHPNDWLLLWCWLGLRS